MKILITQTTQQAALEAARAVITGRQAVSKTEGTALNPLIKAVLADVEISLSQTALLAMEEARHVRSENPLKIV